MPTLITHTAVPLALGLGLGARRVSSRLLIAGLVAAVLPDLDVLAFRLGVAYANPFGHRGFSHSLLFALALGILAALFSSWLHSGRRMAFGIVFLSAASHGLLDMLTDGGLGVAYFWPWSEARFFLPWPVIAVSPFDWRRWLGPAGRRVFASELLWVWLPAALLTCGMRGMRRR